ncbi:MAG: YceH family protein [Bacteroidota bacterium]
MARPTLDPVEVRVLGALVEKALATPDSYPLTLNALVGACNQKTSREPVTDYGSRDVNAALERLMRRGLVGTTSGAGHRVAKFRHNLDRALDLSRREVAALAVLMLRGPQTPGEIRTRAARMADFASVGDAEEALWMLGDRGEPLAAKLPRDPGQSADRFAHVLAGAVPEAVPPEAVLPASEGEPEPPATSRPVAPEAAETADPNLAARVDALEAEVARLGAALEAFQAQFE